MIVVTVEAFHLRQLLLGDVGQTVGIYIRHFAIFDKPFDVFADDLQLKGFDTCCGPFFTLRCRRCQGFDNCI